MVENWGEHRPVRSTRRTASSESRNAQVRCSMASTSRRPAPRAATRSTTCASPKRARWAHKPASGSMRPATVSSHPRRGRSSGMTRLHTWASRAWPVGRPTLSASACHSPRSTSGVREPCLRGRVASDAASSACIRVFGSGSSGPAPARCSSMAWVRLENVRSQAGSNPTISRQPFRSSPHSTPRRSVSRRRNSS